ncbi:MAG: winged helix-turn-helix transcriptional regulator [Angustibacter sp.]
MIERVGDKWSVLVVGQLRSGPARFTELLRGVDGISRRMLTRTLRLLERDGLVVRTVYPTRPPSVEYQLSSSGRALAEPLDALTAWAVSSRARVERARAAFDAAHPPAPGLAAPDQPGSATPARGRPVSGPAVKDRPVGGRR